MKDISQVYFRTQEKKKRKNELSKMIRDDLSNNADYKQMVEELRVLREKKKSIENEVVASCLSDVGEIDSLKLQIASAQELMSDIALTMYTEGKTVEILDEERGVKMTPLFSVKFQKENIDASRP